MSSTFLEKIDALALISQHKLTTILDSIPGKKNLVIDHSLMKPLDRFVGATVLRYHGVDKMYKLENTGSPKSNISMVYIIRADLITSKIVCNQINSYFSSNSNVAKYHIIFVPKILASIEILFEEEGLFDKVNFHSFSWELIQVDSKILSYESPKIFKQLFVDNDQSPLTSIAKSLWSINHLFGKPPICICHGKYSSLIGSLLECYLEELGTPDKLDSDIGAMLVLDRDIDFASGLLIPGTYTSLIPEVMNVATGSVELKQQNKEKKELAVTMTLNSDDEIYNQIKNKHFSDVNVYLKQKANELISVKNKGANMNLQEIKSFVEGQLGKLRNESTALSNHFNICEKICNEMGHKFEMLQTCQTNILYGEARGEVITEIEDLIATSEDMYLPLRLMCLLSLAQNGLSFEESNSLKKQFLHCYGHKHLMTFYNLEKLGMIITPPPPAEISSKIASKVANVVPFPKKNSFQTTTQKLKLFPDVSKNYCLKNPTDAGYVFGGAYIPLVAQFVSYLIKKEMSFNELLKLLPPVKTKLIGSQIDGAAEVNPRTIMVYIVGGITYAEIAALQFIEARTGCRILCCGSNIVSAKSLLQSTIA